jgi:hypothetical protein
MTAHQAAQYVNRPAHSYSRDVAAGLPHLSGFRATLDLTPQDPVYIQSYTTDKALIYQLDGARHALAITCTKALEGTPPRYMDKIYDVYYNARDTHDCAARIELRLWGGCVAETALTLPFDLIPRCLCVFPRVDWW